MGQANKGFPFIRHIQGPIQERIKPGIFLVIYFKEKKKVKLSILKYVFLGDKYILAQPTSH